MLTQGVAKTFHAIDVRILLIKRVETFLVFLKITVRNGQIYGICQINLEATLQILGKRVVYYEGVGIEKYHFFRIILRLFVLERSLGFRLFATMRRYL